MRIVRYLIAALGCLFWAMPLAGAVDRVKTYGFHEDATPLLAIPIVMIVLTAGMGLVPHTHRAFGGILAGATIVAFVAGFIWLGIWGAGV
jgi:hypothetical protein